MNKSELVITIADATGMSKSTAENTLNCTLAVIAETLAKRESVTIAGFGSFSVTDRAARTGRHPQTGQSINIAAKKVAKFKSGKALSKAVNQL